MATQHAITCPECNAVLLVESSDSIGGVVVPNLVVLDSAKPAKATKADVVNASPVGNA